MTTQTLPAPGRLRSGYHRPPTAPPDSGQAWQRRGSCRAGDPDDWFPERHRGDIQTAKRICGGCRVRPECLAAALARGERWGIWGGLTTQERNRLRRQA